MIVRSPAKKKTTVFTNSKLLTQLTKDGSPTKDTLRKISAVVNELAEFKKGLCYKALEQACLMGEDLVEREEELEGTQLRKLELDTEQGAGICRSFLVCVERLYEIMGVEPVSKEYRAKFSKAYKVLYS